MSFAYIRFIWIGSQGVVVVAAADDDVYDDDDNDKTSQTNSRTKVWKNVKPHENVRLLISGY